MIVPQDYDWHLLARDATAIPAIGRRLAELPSGATAIVIVQAEELIALEREKSGAHIDLIQVSTAEEGIKAIDALRLPAGDGYAWCAGEAAAMTQVRDILVGKKGLPKESMRVAAYWKRGASDFHADLAG